MEIKDMVEALNGLGEEVKSLRQKQESEIKELGSVTTETKEEFDQRLEDMNKALIEVQEKQVDLGNRNQEVETKTFGQRVIEELDLKADQHFRKEIKDISGGAGSAGALVRPDRDPTVYRSIGGMRQIRIADLLPTIPAGSNAVEIMRLADDGDPAAPQGTTAGRGAGEFADKAKADLEWELVTVNIPTIAVHTRASRQVLSDAPMLQSMIDGELTYKLQLESDRQILNGDGTGQNLQGILTDSSINDVGEIASGTSADDLPAAMIDHIRAAVTECQKNEYYNINGLVLNPVDWQTLETAKATDGHYLLVAFAATSPETPSVWRIPVIVTNAIGEGDFLLGDWQLGAQLYVREGVTVRTSEHHDTNFTQNAIQILAEQRYGLGVSRPLAFCRGSFAVAA